MFPNVSAECADPLRSVLYKWTPLAVGLALLIALVWLGTWQLHKADEKREFLAEFERIAAAGHQPLDLSVRPWEALRFRPVEFHGRYLPERQFLLDNQVRNGRVGYQVITPAVHEGSGLVLLVERGWVPRESVPGRLPDVVSGLPATRGQVRGQVHVPFSEGYRLGDMDDGSPGWPRVVQYMDFDAMGERLGREVAPITIRLDPDLPHGFPRDWQLVFPMTAERHLAYAVQWYAMALALVVIAVVLTIRRRSRSDEN
jgi:surfeit locus 1 family protein